MTRWLTAVFFCLGGAVALADGNRLAYVDGPCDPYYVGRDVARLTTPQWIGEPGVEAVVVLSIDDMRDTAKYEAYLRPILDRLKKIDGRAALSIMTNRVDPADPQLARWLEEGLSIDVHTLDHPCPCLQGGDLAKAKATYDGCVDLMAAIPGNRPVAYRMPCCDSMNSVSPRFFAEIFSRTTPGGNYLTIDSSVFMLFTPRNRLVPRDVLLDAEGKDRFAKYIPREKQFVNMIEDYPYPYVIDRLCWQLPSPLPSDWEAQYLHEPNNPQTVADMKAVIDAVVASRGVYPLVFHPHGWIRNDQIVELIDHAVEAHGKKVKFLSFREVDERLTKHLLKGHPLRAADGRDNGVRLVDVNADGFMDVVIGNEKAKLTRVWSPAKGEWTETEFPVRFVERDGDARRSDAGVRFGVLQSDGAASVLAVGGDMNGLWHFQDGRWVEDDAGKLPSGLSANGARLLDIDDDGICELIDGGPKRGAVYQWIGEGEGWRKLPFSLPEGTSIVDVEARDAGLRFVDLDRDGDLDAVFSDEQRFSVHLFASRKDGWAVKVQSGKQRGEDAIPPIVRGGTNNGAWFTDDAMYVQNEDTGRLPGQVRKVAYDDLLADVEPGPRSPRQSLRSIEVRPGLAVELVAAEPLVQDPVNIAWGPDGRLWVVEMADYPLGIDGKGKPGGRVRYLSDTDGDGRYDRSTLFLDVIPFPTDVMPWRNGVLVTAAPEIFYAEDTDGDGRADRRETLFSGFGEGNQQHRVNGLRWGLDNWIYVANGDSNGQIRSHKTGKAVSISGRDLRIRPDTGEIDPQSGRAQYGRNRDDWGNWFGSNNSNPMWHYVLADHYLRRNPHLKPPDVRVQVSNQPGAAPVFPISRTLPRFNNPQSAGRFTSACSAMIYRDRYLGEAFYGNSFVCEPVHNLVHREIVSPAGVTFTSRRTDDETQSEFLASADNWFRPTAIRTGPDGALYVVDMYRHVIEHPEWIPKDWQQRLDLRAGADRGRIYRVIRADRPPRKLPNLAKLKTRDLVERLASENGPVRDLAQQLLLQRNDKTAVSLVEETARQNGSRSRKTLDADIETPLGRLHALCTLDGLGALKAELVVAALADAHPGVRRHAIRLSERFLGTDDDSAAITSVADALTRLADDADPQVQMQLAYSLGEWNDPRAGTLLGRLALRHAGDRYVTAAVFSSVHERNVGAMLASVLAAEKKDDPRRADLRSQLLELAAALKSEDVLAQLGRLITESKSPRERFALARAVLSAAGGGKQQAGLPEEMRAALGEIAAAARRFASSDSAGTPHRLAALDVLGRLADARDLDAQAVAPLLDVRQPPEIQQAAVDALERIGTNDAADRVLAGWKNYTPSLRSRAIDALFSRDAWLKRLLAAIESGQVQAGHIDLRRREQLTNHRDDDLRKLAIEVFGDSASGNRADVVKSYSPALTLAGDAGRGKQLFAKHCAACHRLEGAGHPLGPDLATLTNRSPAALLTAILDPNRAVEEKYLDYLVVTADGRSERGMLLAETSTSITLGLPEGKSLAVLRKDVEALQSTGKSLMPEGVEKELSQQDAADLIAYLAATGPPPKSFAGSKPATVRPGKDGSLSLLATNCRIYGPTVVLEEKYKNLGYWQSEQDRAEWTVELDESGEFEVTLDYACADSVSGDKVLIEAADRSLTVVAQGTGTWDDYRQAKIGQVRLPAGTSSVVMRSAGPVRGALIDLRSIRLTRSSRVK